MNLRVVLRKLGQADQLQRHPDAVGWFNRLPNSKQRAAVVMLHDFVVRRHTVQIDKLLGNALRYAVERANQIEWLEHCCVVPGDHDRYVVRWDVPACTCPLFRGQGQFAGRAGMCSHIMTVRLVLTAPLPTE